MVSGYRNQNRQEEWRTSNHSPAELLCERVPGFSVTVLFTTVPGTLAAFREAAHWAAELGAQIQVFVAQAVPYPLPLDQPPVDPEFRLRRFRALCEQASIETRIEIRLCRDRCQCLQDALPPHSLILIGARLPWWPFTEERRLARRLQRLQHQVLLVRPRPERRKLIRSIRTGRKS